MQKTTLSFIFLILAISSQVLASNLREVANQQIYAISYEKTYTILVNGKRSLDFIVYPGENKTAVFNQIYPTANAYEVNEGSFLQYSIEDVSFTLYFTEIKASYCIIRLETTDDVKIADPSTVNAQQDQNQQGQVSDNSQDIAALKDQIKQEIEDEIRQEITQIIQQEISKIDTSGGISKEQAQQIAQKIVDANKELIKRETEDAIVENYLNEIMQKINKLEKSSSSMMQNPVMMQLMQENPQMGILMVILDPSTSEQEKQQALLQLIAMQQAAKRKRILLISAGIAVPCILGLVIILWKWKQKQATPMSMPGLR